MQTGFKKFYVLKKMITFNCDKKVVKKKNIEKNCL